MDLGRLLPQIASLRDLPALLVALGHEGLAGCPPAQLWPGRRNPAGTVVLGHRGEFPWFGLASTTPERSVRALARRLAARGRLGGVIGLDPAGRRLAVAVAFDGVPTRSLDLSAPDSAGVACLGRLAGSGDGGALAYAARAADALSGESVGRRFYREFRATLERMAAGIRGDARGEDRRALALLQLTRVLFLYFVQAKGWLAGRPRFLAEEVDRSLAGRRQLQRDLLRPLFFGTLNRPASSRGRCATRFGAIPFLNGGLFEPHPLERRLRGDIPNQVWRDAFDCLFERFHFTVGEGKQGGIAPDMLGRVFEGVMEPNARRASGTFYTPAALVRRMLDAGCAAWVAGRLGVAEAEAERRLQSGDRSAVELLGRVTILDPAVGSGAFLVGALQLLSSFGPASPARIAARRRRILQRNLFGVDRSATAVRLTELRLWLAVIAEDPTELPERVAPLPNLDCLIRQGDSLFDPAGSARWLSPTTSPLAHNIAALRGRVVTVAGPAKQAAVRDLRRAEARAAADALAGAETRVEAAVAACLAEARGGDLFGRRRGLDAALRSRLDELKGELRSIRAARRTLARDHELPWFQYQCHFADVFARGGFDLVVGNPPWLRAEQIPPGTRRRLSGRYRFWRGSGGAFGGKPDLAVAFVERAVELTAPGGAVALLVPAKLATAGYGAFARHGLAASTTLVTVGDLVGDEDAAFDATVYPLALILRKSPAPAGHKVRVRLEPSAQPTVEQAGLRGGGPWILSHDRVRHMVERLGREHPLVRDRLTCQLGVKTGANEIFLDPGGEIEPELLRWAVRGRDLRPFQIRPRRRLLWAHDRAGRPLVSLPPLAAAYLAPHERLLRARSDFNDGPTWGLFRTGPASAPHRVVWADLARQLTAAALTGPAGLELIPLNSCYVASVRSGAEAARLAAYLNSTWIRAAARLGSVPAASGFVRFTAATVARLPLPATVLTDDELAALAAAGRRGEVVQDELDDVVARHLGLSPAERGALREVVVGSPDDRR